MAAIPMLSILPASTGGHNWVPGYTDKYSLDKCLIMHSPRSLYSTKGYFGYYGSIRLKQINKVYGDYSSCYCYYCYMVLMVTMVDMVNMLSMVIMNTIIIMVLQYSVIVQYSGILRQYVVLSTLTLVWGTPSSACGTLSCWNWDWKLDLDWKRDWNKEL